MSHETLHHSAVRHVRRVLAMLQAQMQRQPHVVFAPRRLRFLPEDLGMGQWPLFCKGLHLPSSWCFMGFSWDLPIEHI